MSLHEQHGLDPTLERYVDLLVQARRGAGAADRPCSEAMLDVEAAYGVQQLFRDRHCADGERRLVGYRIGASASGIQARLGIAEPVIGMVFSDDVLPSPAVLPANGFHVPVVHAELVFVLREALPELCSRELIIASSDVAPAVGIADSRLVGWPDQVEHFSAQDIILDNALSGGVVVGPRVSAAAVDLCALSALVQVGRPPLRHVPVLADPVAAVGWLARTVHRIGGRMARGTIVSTGVLGGPSLAGAGSLRVDLGDLGQASATILPAAGQPP